MDFRKGADGLAALVRAISPIALSRKKALFAGSDGGVHGAVIASLIETCKLNGIKPHAIWSTSSPASSRPSHSGIDALTTWAYAHPAYDPVGGEHCLPSTDLRHWKQRALGRLLAV